LIIEHNNENISNRQNYVDTRQKIYAFKYDIFQFVKNTLWTHSLKREKEIFCILVINQINEI